MELSRNTEIPTFDEHPRACRAKFAIFGGFKPHAAEVCFQKAPLFRLNM
jgi:hypothetical protein